MRPGRQLRDAARRPQQVEIVEPDKRKVWIRQAGFWRDATAQAVGGLWVAGIVGAWAAWSGLIPWNLVARFGVFLLVGSFAVAMGFFYTRSIPLTDSSPGFRRLWRGFWWLAAAVVVVGAAFVIFTF